MQRPGLEHLGDNRSCQENGGEDAHNSDQPLDQQRHIVSDLFRDLSAANRLG